MALFGPRKGWFNAAGAGSWRVGPIGRGGGTPGLSNHGALGRQKTIKTGTRLGPPQFAEGHITSPPTGYTPHEPRAWWLFGGGRTGDGQHNAMLDGAGRLPWVLMGFRSVSAAPEWPAGAVPGRFAQNRAKEHEGNYIPIPVAFLNSRTSQRMLQQVPLSGPRDTSTASALALQQGLADQLRGASLPIAKGR